MNTNNNTYARTSENVTLQRHVCNVRVVLYITWSSLSANQSAGYFYVWELQTENTNKIVELGEREKKVFFRVTATLEDCPTAHSFSDVIYTDWLSNTSIKWPPPQQSAYMAMSLANVSLAVDFTAV